MKTVSLVILGFWISAALLGRVFGLDGNAIDLNNILSSPNAVVWFGADELGRDILARILRGVEVSLMVSVAVTIVTMTLGVSVGLLAGFYGGKLDQILMHITNVFLAFPGMLLAIAFAAVLGPSMMNVIFALCLTGWVDYARLTRGQTLSLRTRQHVLASASLGATPLRILWRHILPLLLSVLIVEATYSLASIMIAEASLSFLGLGIQAPNASWGSMLRDAVRTMLVAPHYVLLVGVSLMSLILAINLGGDYLRDQLDIASPNNTN